MARSRKSIESQVVSFFTTAELGVARVVFGIVRGILAERRDSTPVFMPGNDRPPVPPGKNYTQPRRGRPPKAREVAPEFTTTPAA